MRQAPVSGKQSNRTAKMDSRNPCIGLCRFGGDGACLGCHRTKAEVKGWKRLGNVAKAAINDRIRAGIGTTPQQGGEAGPVEEKTPRKRLRKLDRKIGKLEAKLALLRGERDRLSGGHGQTPESSRVSSAVPPSKRPRPRLL